MDNPYTSYAGLFKALADPNRLMILDMLSCGELCACMLLEQFSITQPTLSHHMKILSGCGLVNGRKDGKWMHYSINAEAVRTGMDFLNALTSKKDDCICRTPFNEKRSDTMSEMTIYEPALCCETGLCGVAPDPELLRISTTLNALKKAGVEVKRYNLNSAPTAFVDNQTINQFLNEHGVDGLPAVMLDGEIILSGRYPSNSEFMSLLGVSKDQLRAASAAAAPAASDCCCSGGTC